MLQELLSLGYDAKLHRDKPILANCYVDTIVNGVPVSYTRRRYGSTTFTWVHYYDGEWREIREPWPAITPKRAEVVEAIRLDRQLALHE